MLPWCWSWFSVIDIYSTGQEIQWCIEPTCSVPCCQKLATEPCPGPIESSLHPLSLFFWHPFPYSLLPVTLNSSLDILKIMSVSVSHPRAAHKSIKHCLHAQGLLLRRRMRELWQLREWTDGSLGLQGLIYSIALILLCVPYVPEFLQYLPLICVIGIVFSYRDHIFIFVSQNNFFVGAFFVYLKRRFQYRWLMYCIVCLLSHLHSSFSWVS